MANEAIGKDTILEISEDAGTTWTEVARITEIGEFSLGEFDDIDITAHDTVGNFREYMSGLADAGEVAITGIWTAAASQSNLNSIKGVTNDFRITLPDTLGIWEAKGYIKSVVVNPQFEDRIEFSATIKVTGSPTFS